MAAAAPPAPTPAQDDPTVGGSGYRYGAPAAPAPTAAGAAPPPDDSLKGESGYVYGGGYKPPPPPPSGPSSADQYLTSHPVSNFLANTTLGKNLWAGAQTLGEGGNELAELAYKAAAAFPMGYDKVKSMIGGHPTTQAQDWWFKTNVDPLVAHEAAYNLRPGATFGEKASAVAGGMGMQIAEAVVTGGDAEAPRALGAGASLLDRIGPDMVHGIKSMQLPAVANAVHFGQQVLDATGDKAKAVTAAIHHWALTSLTGLLPASVPGGRLTRAATGAASQTVLGEAQREGQNADLPAGQQTPFDWQQTALNAIGGAMLGVGLGHAPENPEAARSTYQKSPLDVANERLAAPKAAANSAAAQVRAQGGDALSQTLAASQASLEARGGQLDLDLSAPRELRTQQSLPLQGGEGIAPPAPGEQGALPLNEPENLAQRRLQLQDEQGAQLERNAAFDEAQRQQLMGGITHENVNAAFEAAEQARLKQVQKEEHAAFAQREQQLAAGAEAGGATEAPATLGDVAPDDVKAMAQGAPAAPTEAEGPIAPTEATPPEPPKPAEFAVEKTGPSTWTLKAGDTVLAHYPTPQKAAQRMLMLRKEQAATPAPVAESATGAAPEVSATRPTSTPSETAAPALPAPKDAGFVVNAKGEAQPVTEAGLEAIQRGGKPAENLTVRRNAVAVEQPAAPIKEVQVQTKNPAGWETAGDHVETGQPVETQPLEPQKEGTTRLWRGNRPGEITGTRYTTDLEGIARPFAKAYGGHLSYVDVPNERFQQLKENGGVSPTEWNLPPDLHATAKAVEPDAGLPEERPGPITPKAKTLADRRAQRQFKASQRLRFKTQDTDWTAAKGPELGRAARAGDPAAQKELARRLNALPSEPRTNNASGESAASQEAINRFRDERAAGQRRYMIDPDGNATELTSPTDVDRKAPPGHMIVQRGIGNEPHTILDRGGLPLLHARGLLARAEANGQLRYRAGERGAPEVRKEDVQAQLAQHPELRSAQVHQRVTDAPAHIQEGMQRDGQMDARGVYDPTTDTVHIFAENHQSPAEAVTTAIHETVAHKGLRALLGDQHDSVMSDIWNRGKGREWMRDFIAQHGLDEADPTHQTIAAEEYAAHLAENTPQSTLLGRVRDAIRGALRKLGVVKDWTDSDIHALLRQSKSRLADVSDAVERPPSANALRYAETPIERTRVENGAHPLGIFDRYGATMEDVVNRSPGFFRSRLTALQDLGTNHIDKLLSLVPRRNITDFIAKSKLPALRMANQLMQRMEARTNELVSQSYPDTKRWATYVAKNKDGARVLGELMHASTLAEVDPSKPYENYYTKGNLTDEQKTFESERKARWQQLKGYYDGMDSEGKYLYNAVRDHHQNMRSQVMDALQKRIEASQASGSTKKGLIDEMRQQYENGRKGPYFPLTRFGDWWANAKDKEGNTISFARFEKPSEQKQWQQEMEQKGYVTDGGRRSANAKEMLQRIDPKFVESVVSKAKEVDPQLADDIWQHFLQTMPENSMRKYFIHRKGRLGFSANALRGFSSTMFHGARQLAKLEMVHDIENQLAAAHDQARQLEAAKDPEAHWAIPLVDEMGRRYEALRNPNSATWAVKTASFGFGWLHGWLPSSALTNLMQTPTYALPLMGAQHGWGKAAVELARASRQFAGSRGDFGSRLRGDERLAWDTGKRTGMFGQTQAHMMVGLGEGADPTSVATKMGESMSWMFHHTEDFNRQTTFMAAYRLGRADGMTHDQAMDHAENMTWDSHFDYSYSNRPRVLQGNWQRVLLLFKSYGMNAYYRLLREGKNGILGQPGQTPAERSLALKRFGGLVGMSAMTAGVTGLPMYWAVEALYNSIMGNKDQPADMTDDMHHHLAETVGPDAATAVLHGPTDVALGGSLSGRMGFNGMFIHDSPEMRDEGLGAQLGNWISGAVGGSMLGMVERGASAMDMLAKGHGDRALERVLPTEASDVVKAFRYYREGVKNMKGDTLLSPDQIDARDLFVQSMGLTPTKVTRAYEQANAVRNEADLIQARKKTLVSNATTALMNDDQQGAREAMQDIAHFNDANPEDAISGSEINNYARSFAKQRDEALQGVYVSPKLYGLHQRFDFSGGK